MQWIKSSDEWYSLFIIVPELVARGVICQVFPLHEQRILSQLMTSWVQAVCERQPLGEQHLLRQYSITYCYNYLHYKCNINGKIHISSNDHSLAEANNPFCLSFVHVLLHAVLCIDCEKKHLHIFPQQVSHLYCITVKSHCVC